MRSEPITISVGDRVRLTRPENPGHPRTGMVGVVREASLYHPRAPWVRHGDRPKPPPPPRWWLWVEFPDRPHDAGGAYLSPLWGDEVDLITDRGEGR